MRWKKSDGAKIEIEFDEIINPLEPKNTVKPIWNPDVVTISSDSSTYTRGLRFLVNKDISAVQLGCYNNAETEVKMHLWDCATSQKLTEVTFTTKADGWSYVDIEAVQLKAGKEYVVSINTPVNGNTTYSYSMGSDLFNNVTPKGYYYNGSVDTYPSSSYSSSYLPGVDLRFAYLDKTCGNDGAFKIEVPEYDFVPGGTIGTVEKKVSVVSNKVGVDVLVDFSDGTLNDLENTNGVLALEVIE